MAAFYDTGMVEVTYLGTQGYFNGKEKDNMLEFDYSWATASPMNIRPGTQKIARATFELSNVEISDNIFSDELGEEK